MKAFIAVLALLPVLSFAQSRPELENRVENALRNVRNSLRENLQRMSDRDLIEVERHLNRASDTANGGYNPNPNPYPMRACAQDRVEVFQQTFITIKSFAYNTANQSTQNSIAYATSWTNKYPCHVAEKFIQDYTRIKTHAYNAMNMSTINSIAYAEKMVGRVCSNIPFEDIFNQQKTFAYNTLNMSTINSIAYATPKMEAEGFSCNNY